MRKSKTKKAKVDEKRIRVRFGPTPETAEPFYLGSYVPNGPRFIGQLYDPYSKDAEICRFEENWRYHPK